MRYAGNADPSARPRRLEQRLDMVFEQQPRPRLERRRIAPLRLERYREEGIEAGRGAGIGER